MADNTTIPQPGVGSGGDIVRTIQRSDGAKREVVAFDLGGGSAYPENLINAGQDTMLNSVPVTSAWDQPSDPALVAIVNLLTRLFPQGETLFTPFQELTYSLKGILAETFGTPPTFTALSSAAITNPTSVLARPTSAITSAVTATSATPCVFTWTGNLLQNGMAIVLGGSAVPTGFTAGTVYFVVAAATNTFELAATVGGGAIASSSTGTSVTATIVYASNCLVASSLTSPAVPFFSIPTISGGTIIPRIRVSTNATSGWGGIVLSINLWNSAPTYTLGDGQPYNPAGAASWLGNFLVTLNQFADGAVGAGNISSATQITTKLLGSSVWWDIQILTQATPTTTQTFTLTAELLN